MFECTIYLHQPFLFDSKTININIHTKSFWHPGCVPSTKEGLNKRCPSPTHAYVEQEGELTIAYLRLLRNRPVRIPYQAHHRRHRRPVLCHFCCCLLLQYHTIFFTTWRWDWLRHIIIEINFSLHVASHFIRKGSGRRRRYGRSRLHWRRHLWRFFNVCRHFLRDGTIRIATFDHLDPFHCSILEHSPGNIPFDDFRCIRDTTFVCAESIVLSDRLDRTDCRTKCQHEHCHDCHGEHGGEYPCQASNSVDANSIMNKARINRIDLVAINKFHNGIEIQSHIIGYFIQQTHIVFQICDLIRLQAACGRKILHQIGLNIVHVQLTVFYERVEFVT
mmetsp:Transcript_25002/g.42831  ORF Transcript_25002/g.42831 Transcript_25002/m.42831 type:complete len:333 (-) Transcript_25002:1932-2930(-)